MPDPEHVSTTRAAYDDTADVYAQWVGTEISSAIEGPIDRALLGAFVPVPDGSLAGAVCWYSIIHTPAEHLGTVGAELLRALAPGAHLLVAFQAGNGERVHRSEVHGRPVSLTSYRHAPDEVAGCLAGAGLQVLARAVREAESAHESTPQAFILARSPTVPA